MPKEPLRIPFNTIECIRYDAEAMIITFTDAKKVEKEVFNLDEYRLNKKREFWSKYPAHRKPVVDAVKFAELYDAYGTSKDKVDQMNNGLERWLTSEQWSKDKGSYIPNIVKFIEERKFIDECITSTTTKQATPMLSQPEQEKLLRQTYGESCPKSSVTDEDLEKPEVLWNQVKMMQDAGNPTLAKERARQLIARGIPCPDSLKSGSASTTTILTEKT